MGQITHEDLNQKLSEEIKENSKLSKENEGKLESLESLPSELSEHIEDKDNPHSVTASQVGAATQQEFEEHVSTDNLNAHEVVNIEGLRDELDSKADKLQMKEIDLPLVNGWENVIGNISFYKDDFDTVNIYGIIRTTKSGDLDVTTIPENYRPKTNYYTFSISSADDKIRTTIVNSNTGVLRVSRVEANSVYVVDCSYRLDREFLLYRKKG